MPQPCSSEMWRKDYVDNPKVKLATPTREKYRSRLDNHILPRWKATRLGEFRSKEILDWAPERMLLLAHDDRPPEHHDRDFSPRAGVGNPGRDLRQPLGAREGWEEADGAPGSHPLTQEETAEVFSRLVDPQMLICETCISAGTRISEAVGLQLKHLDLKAATIKIQQRHCRGDVDEPKTKNSKRTLALGTLTDRYKAWIAKQGITKPDDWIFSQEEDRTKPMWDSGVRKTLKIAAVEAKCDFPGFGLHSFRRANITWRQEVGGSAIEASKIAGHANVSMTGDYTIVQLQRQDDLTRAIQGRMAEAKKKQKDDVRKQAGEPVDVAA